MEQLYLDKTISELKSLFQKSKPTNRLYPVVDEQKGYVKKLNIILGGFIDYLNTEKKKKKNDIQIIMEDIEIFLQIYHLDYSETLLPHLDAQELIYFLKEFLPRKSLNLTKIALRNICISLKLFITFLREKLNYYPKKAQFRKILESLKPNKMISSIKWDEIEDPNGSFSNSKLNTPLNKLFTKFTKFLEENNNNKSKLNTPLNKLFTKFMEENKNNLFNQEMLKKEKERSKLFNSIHLEDDLGEWYTTKELKVAKIILENIYKNYLNLKSLNKKGLLAAIDHTLNEIFSKGLTQNKIATRHNTSSTTLTKYRYKIGSCIPLEYYFPLFLSEAELNSNKEKTFIFKVSLYNIGHDSVLFELLESNTLEDLHYSIQECVNIDPFSDHLYSFFMNGILWDRATEYAGPPEYQKELTSQQTDIQLKNLNLGYKQRFLYLYDYGAMIRFNVTVVGLGIYDENKTYPYKKE